MCDKAVNTCPFLSDCVPDLCINQEVCDKVVSKDPFILKYCPDKFKTKEVCDKAIDSHLLTLKLLTDWFVTNKMIDKLDSATFSDDYIVFGDLDSDFATAFSKDINLHSITIDNINLDDYNFDYCDPETISHVRLMGW